MLLDVGKLLISIASTFQICIHTDKLTDNAWSLWVSYCLLEISNEVLSDDLNSFSLLVVQGRIPGRHGGWVSTPACLWWFMDRVSTSHKPLTWVFPALQLHKKTFYDRYSKLGTLYCYYTKDTNWWYQLRDSGRFLKNRFIWDFNLLYIDILHTLTDVALPNRLSSTSEVGARVRYRRVKELLLEVVEVDPTLCKGYHHQMCQHITSTLVIASIGWVESAYKTVAFSQRCRLTTCYSEQGPNPNRTVHMPFLLYFKLTLLTMFLGYWCPAQLITNKPEKVFKLLVVKQVSKTDNSS